MLVLPIGRLAGFATVPGGFCSVRPRGFPRARAREGYPVFWTTQIWQWSRVLLNALLACLTARPGAALLVTPKVLLFSGSAIPSADSVVADFTPAVYSGYGDVALTLTGPVDLTPDGQAMIGTATFTSTTASPFVPDTVTGYIVYDGATAYYGGERFDAPVEISAAGQFIAVNVQLPLPLVQNTSFGG